MSAQSGSALLRYWMAEVYSVLLFTAPSEGRAYPVRHQDVDAAPAPRLNVQPNRRRSHRSARLPEEHRRNQRSYPHLAVLPACTEVLREPGLLRLEGLLRMLRPAHLKDSIRHSEPRGLDSICRGLQPCRKRWDTAMHFELPFSPGHHRTH
jgi:hypothetical protein